MSMNKMFKKVLAVVAAGAMTMGMAMPTFAAEGGKVTEAYGLAKTYNTEVGKAEKFSFTADAGQNRNWYNYNRCSGYYAGDIIYRY